MKKNAGLIVVVLVLAAATIYFVRLNRSSTVREELKDFAVKDTAAITKVFLADKAGNSVTITRDASGGWFVNSNPARRTMIKSLMDVLHGVDVRNRVAKSAYKNVVGALASTGIKCEIYLNNEDEPGKVYYIGGHTQDDLGTFMMLENSSVPFVTHIPGFNGYLTPRYSVKEKEWKENSVFKVPLNELASVDVSYLAFPGQSFRIENNETGYVVSSPLSETKLSNPDTTAIRNYLDFYAGVYYESLAEDIRPTLRDSVLGMQPSITIHVKKNDGETLSALIRPMPIHERSITQTDSLGNPLQYDLDRMFAELKPSGDLVVIQHFTWDPLFRQLNDFQLKRD